MTAIQKSSRAFARPAVGNPQGGVSGYYVIVGTTPGGSDVFSGTITGTSLTVTNNFGAHLSVEVSAINNAGIQSPAGPVSAGVALVDPAWIPELKIINSNVLSWNSVSGKTYQVWSTTNLFIPFSALGSPINALGPMASYTNSPATGTRYFRVQFIP